MHKRNKWQVAQAWANRRRNPDKRVYAIQYLGWLRFGCGEKDEPQVSNHLPYMAAQAVRIELHEITGITSNEVTSRD